MNSMPTNERETLRPIELQSRIGGFLRAADFKPDDAAVAQVTVSDGSIVIERVLQNTRPANMRHTNGSRR